MFNNSEHTDNPRLVLELGVHKDRLGTIPDSPFSGEYKWYLGYKDCLGTIPDNHFKGEYGIQGLSGDYPRQSIQWGVKVVSSIQELSGDYLRQSLHGIILGQSLHGIILGQSLQ